MTGAAAPTPARPEPGSPPRRATTATPLPELADALAHRRWVRRERPFPHVVASNVFTPQCYAVLDAEFRRIEAEHPETFHRNMAGYDAAGALLDRYRDGPLGLFVSRPWHDLLAGLFGVPATGDMTASLHHHDPGGASGWPHNDLNPGWFADPPAGRHDVRLPTDAPASARVGYHHGDRPPDVGARETVRAVSALFYLANPEWEAGDGGETALYAHPGDRVPRATVPPLPNSLVAFECTPYSWHGFVGNRAKPRNCVVMWVHRDRADVERRWGAQSIVPW
ncbi:2OG-Fe(II) oxygenase [Jatrophihabitans endophyticus]|uniref:2OG-Fe(II) oxygenase n=1 Tax=Jatrophihabitans endophyticus TaxID=1206085 RepID=UPI00190EA325|nr:2OG-Fe(II) oxygenase [Jatrophihabitans endophyticus]